VRPLPSSRARELRKSSTPAEQALWVLVRDRRLRALKFRRQSPISIYCADFYCHALKLIVELDGEIHEAPNQRAHDENRDSYLRSLGHTILRFSNEAVFNEPAAVLDRILEEAQRLESTTASAT
jgi:type I restriction enzyme R subunit